MGSSSFSTPPTPSALTSLLSTHSSSSSSSTTTQPAPTTALPLEIVHNLRHQHFWTGLQLHHLASASASASDLDLDLKFDLDLDSVPKTETPTAPTTTTSSRDETRRTRTRATAPVVLLSGTPPRPLYTHPDLQRKLLKAGIAEADLEVEREWVVPTTVARKWTFAELCAVFDSLPRRPMRRLVRNEDGGVEEGRRRKKKEKEKEKKRRGRMGSGKGRRSTDTDADTDADTETETEGEVAAVVVEHQDVKRVLLAMKAHEGLGGDGTVVYYIVQEGEVKPRQN